MFNNEYRVVKISRLFESAYKMGEAMNNISCFGDEKNATTSHHANSSPIKYWREVSTCSKSPNQVNPLSENDAKKVEICDTKIS